MKKHILVVIILLLSTETFAQNSDFAPGIYLTFEDFISQNPISPELIITDLYQEEVNFYEQLFKDYQVKFTQDGTTMSFTYRTIWGYSDGQEVYISLERLYSKSRTKEHPFIRLNTSGELSLILFLVPTETGGNMPTEMMLDLRDGKIYATTLNNLESLISNDTELLNEFKNFKKNRSIKFYTFLKKYNERHPFLLN